MKENPKDQYTLRTIIKNEIENVKANKYMSPAEKESKIKELSHIIKKTDEPNPKNTNASNLPGILPG